MKLQSLPRLLLLLLTATLVMAAAENRKPAPGFSLADLSGKTVKLADLRGKAVLVNFWSSTCPPCIAEIPELNRLLAKMKGKPFAILALTGDRKKLAQDVARQLDIKFTVLLDPDDNTALAYGVYGLPTTYIVGPDGAIDNKVIGPANWSDQSIVDYLDNLIKKSGQ